MPSPPLVSANVCVVAVELVPVRLNAIEVDDSPIAGLTAGCTWRTRRFPSSARYRLPAESSVMP